MNRFFTFNFFETGGIYLAFVLLFLSLSLAGQELSKPNILWITTEDISPAWGCYGDENATTPNIDAIAEQGYIFTNAFSNAPICAPARSTLISGMYATSLGTQNLRSEIGLPENFRTLPELLRHEGYFTSNNSKTDYNFSEEGRWDDLGREAHWRNNKDQKPFFSVFNFMGTHEGQTNKPNPEQTQSLAEKHRPNRMKVPPYFPDTEGFKEIMAHQYDLITVFDQWAGNIISELKKDGLYDDTIIFIFSDHGHGLPRYKRWLYNSGLQVPFVLYVPEKYKSLVPHMALGKVDLNVSFVDFAPTVLKCVGATVPDMMEGHPFLGKNARPQTYTYGYRDRADDAYDMSRSVFDGRYFYVRNFMPHLPYIQDVEIFGDQKWAYRELHNEKQAGRLSDESMKMFLPKPIEELYDLQTDPYELENLMRQEGQKSNVERLRGKLREHMVDTHDTGLMNEGRMMVVGKNTSVYEAAHDPVKFNVTRAFEAADQVGRFTDSKSLDTLLQSTDPNVRYWGLVAMQDVGLDVTSYKKALLGIIKNDISPPNKYLAAEILVNRLDETERAMQLFRDEIVEQKFEPMLLQLAIAVRNIGKQAKPLIPVIKEHLYPRISGDIWGKYRDWYYAMFIGFALDRTFKNCEYP